jgi:tRNA pseudouridine38-40 synthase
MPRYFIELSYQGTNYSGFQIQENAPTVQSEVEKAFQILHRNAVALTGSSRTDAGVHAVQNFFHFDYEGRLNPQFVYKMNALLPPDIAIKAIHQMKDNAHCRFDAISREYIYYIHQFKNPFLKDNSFFYPYKLNCPLMHEAAELIKEQSNFFAFAKTNSQVKNYTCHIYKSSLTVNGETLAYNIEANRFLRGMVRAVTATLLKVGREKLSIEELEQLFKGKTKAGTSVPAHALFLKSVLYPENYFVSIHSLL